MKISINDDFSLKKIAESGQCFRVKEFTASDSASNTSNAAEASIASPAGASICQIPPSGASICQIPPAGTFRFIYRNSVLYIREEAAGIYEVSCTAEEWEKIWFTYFDLGTDYSAVRASIPSTDIYLTNAAESARGIRILRQDPWEMLITFIISQRKNIPAIKHNVEQICSLFGSEIHTQYEDLYLFPTAEQIHLHDLPNPELLQNCKLGYRLPYVKDAVEKVYSNQLDPENLNALSDEDLTLALKTVKGVGEKIANCVSLFGYHRTANAPIDVWIKRTIDEHYQGQDPFPQYNNTAGIMQQFLYYYAITGKSHRNNASDSPDSKKNT